MKRILSIIIMMTCAAELMNSCQTLTLEVKEGVPMTIQASIVTPPETKTFYAFYDYTEDKTLEGYWNEKEYITVVSFGQNGITAVDTFESVGVEGRKKAEFTGTWTGNEGDRIICLYPSVDSYAGYSIFDAVGVGSPTIYMRNLSTPSSPLQNDDTGSVSEVDLMLGEVTFGVDNDDDDYGEYYGNNDNQIHVYLKHQIAVFRITATLQSLPFYGEPYFNATVNTIRISAVDSDGNERVFVRQSCLKVTTDYDRDWYYTGIPFTIEKGPLDYYLTNSGNNSAFHMNGKDPVTMTFYVPVRFDEDLKTGYELHLQFGGYYHEYYSGKSTYIDVFPCGDKRIKLTETLPLQNGKVYDIKVTI